jgi:hypothetical protein
MSIQRIACLALLAGTVLAGSAHAQDDARRLDAMAVAPSSTAGTTSATSAGTAPATASPTSANAKPGTYYGDTSGVPVVADGDDTAESCDDTTYNKPQVHGTVGVGVFGGDHASGSYRSGAVNVSKHLGDCEHRTGSLSLTVSDTQSQVDTHPRHR